MQNLFTTRIGEPNPHRRQRGGGGRGGGRKRKQSPPPFSSPMPLQPANRQDLAANTRRDRMQLRVRSECLRFAYSVLDVNYTGNVSEQDLRDIADEIKYLIANGKTEQEREKQRCVAQKGQRAYDEDEKNEQYAYDQSHDLDVTSEEEEEEEDSSEQDAEDANGNLRGFVVDDEGDESGDEHGEVEDFTQKKALPLIGDTTTQTKRVKKNIVVSDSEDEGEWGHATNLEELD